MLTLVGLLMVASNAMNVPAASYRSEEHTSELKSPCNLGCRLLLVKKIDWPHPTCLRHRPKANSPSIPEATSPINAIRNCQFFFKGSGPPRDLPPFPTRASPN